MQLDMHFYGVYALARAAGLDPKKIKYIGLIFTFEADLTW